MARTTVEDCIENVPNRYDLVLLASKRAHQLSRMSRPLLGDGGAAVSEKPPVVALREIAAGLVTDDNVDSLAAGSSRNIDVADAFISRDAVGTDQDAGAAAPGAAADKQGALPVADPDAANSWQQTADAVAGQSPGEGMEGGAGMEQDATDEGQ